jgi:hypothetical protein
MLSVAEPWSPAELAVLRTVVYASLFEYPLTCAELRRTLLQSSQTEADILRTYRASPRLQAAVEYRHGLFFPRGRAPWIDQRRRREIRSLAFLDRHRRWLEIICALPFVRLVALSGSLAVLNADHRADLDLFVITHGRRAWMVTLAVVLLAKLTRRRKTICLNFVMTDVELTLETQDMFSANQVIQLRPVLGLETYDAFVAANPFVRTFYPNFRNDVPSPVTIEPGALASRLKRAAEALLRRPSRAIDTMCQAVYGWHLRRRATSWRSPGEVRLRSDYVKLHTHSHRASVLARFEDLVAETIQSAELESRREGAAKAAS